MKLKSWLAYLNPGQLIQHNQEINQTLSLSVVGVWAQDYDIHHMTSHDIIHCITQKDMGSEGAFMHATCVILQNWWCYVYDDIRIWNSQDMVYTFTMLCVGVWYSRFPVVKPRLNSWQKLVYICHYFDLCRPIKYLSMYMYIKFVFILLINLYICIQKEYRDSNAKSMQALHGKCAGNASKTIIPPIHLYSYYGYCAWLACILHSVFTLQCAWQDNWLVCLSVPKSMRKLSKH